MSTQPLDPRRWRALTVLALAQFMVVLDVTIVNVALPDIRSALGFSESGLQWVVNAYTLMFGGFLLLGGRAADLLGRRGVFLAGLGLFAGGSLAAGLSPSSGVLIAARAVQGLGGALLSPAAMSIVTTLFGPGPERTRAMGVWASLAGLGGTAGVVLGGVLVDALGWSTIFFVNVPIAIALVPFVFRFVPESRDTGERTFDGLGAVTVTAGLMALVYGMIGTDDHGWTSARTLVLFGVAAAPLASFVAIEARSSRPLVPLSLFRSRALTSGNLAQIVMGGAFLAMFFLTALYLQSVLGMSALTAGLAFVPMGVTAIGGAVVASALVQRLGTRPVFMIGAVLGVGGLALLTGVSAGGSYVSDVLPGILVFGAAIPFTGIPNQILGVSGAGARFAGIASGLVNASYQVGAAIGLAAVTTVATAHADALTSGGASPADALAGGYARGFLATTIIAALNLALAFTVSPRLTADDVDPALIGAAA